IASSLDRAFQRVERRHEPAGRELDLDGRGLRDGRTVGSAIAHAVSRGPSSSLPGRQKPRFGKRLEAEIYVARKASATPARSYAPLSNFSQLHAFDCLGLPEPRCYPAPALAGRRALPAQCSPPPKRFISDGFSS